VFVLAGLLVMGFVGMRRLHWPVTWPWLLLYAVCITLLCRAAPVHIEVLLPAFVLGSMLAYPEHAAHTRAGMLVVNGVVGAFMVLVGLSMPFVLKGSEALVAGAMPVARITTSVPALGWQWLALHVLAVTALANLGKMFVVLCYRREASLRERLALGIGMWPRGEVGGGVLVVSMSYGIDGPVVTVAMLSLVLNLVLTGMFIVAVKKVMGDVVRVQGA
jgi:Kef-type K+ transport system membrane component KefB